MGRQPSLNGCLSETLRLGDRRVGDNWVWNWSNNIKPESRTGSQLQNMESLIHHIHLVNSEDKWSWDLGPDGVFSVAGTRRALDDHFLDDGDRPTRWSRLVPIKVEVVSHVFIHCDVARHVWENTFRWIDMAPPMYSSINELLEWVDSCNSRLKRKQVLEAIVQTSIWVLWKFMNNMIFGPTKMKKTTMLIVNASSKEQSPEASRLDTPWTMGGHRERFVLESSQFSDIGMAVISDVSALRFWCGWKWPSDSADILLRLLDKHTWHGHILNGCPGVYFRWE
ncbi:RNA-directed DNA polymerase, eukaryota, Reverse transcriptase zinc-binding domain protein [Artemisia annua]|uniref:RNA-directed DNA polymerase, eukaryota, Reverse transcriptase zinc-binding domain protein n=1 Tax=Artemisia annua TaxID=35608 RepID=A0A2U1NMQ2_ARTAN|nr:RNA-directed DNA polymerase, eukaryota, Reverse transcriptase zinc-binding domain protein [Artemisia annua]